MKQENFVLLSVKVTPEKTLVSFTTPDTVVETQKKSKKRPHPDLVTEIAKLDQVLNTVYKNNVMTATGIVISKSDKGEKIIVTGKITFSSGREIGVSSESFTQDGYYDFEDELWDIKKNISEETYAYLFEGKTADTQIEMNIPDAKEGSEEDLNEEDQAELEEIKSSFDDSKEDPL